ncbi:regulation of nuclear pre-mRNA domain-containing protein 2-like [Ornithodoros turicata]|uniref:regulation of nuclear pre-mRNA domain-containing protein 2-like n=1 Tax=Ornithodoros turicata TaxID=34597 RepID=UPI0031395A9D
MSFSESNLAKKFTTLANTQDSVQTLSLWLIHHKAHHRKIVETWTKVLKKSKAGHRLTMLYLANDVLQNGKRKGIQQFVDSFGDALPSVIAFFKDEKIIKQVDRVFTIWSERNVYSTEFASQLKDDLHGTSNAKSTHASSNDEPEKSKEPSKKTKQPKLSSSADGAKLKQPDIDKIILEFKPQKVIEKIKKMKKVENETTNKLAALTSRNMDASSSEVLRKFKDRSHGQQFQKDFDEATKCLEEYIQALEKEVEDRAEIVELLGEAKVYYDNQHGEARIVATAYKNFGNRVKSLKKKLEARVKTLPSPVPSPTPDAPSPTNSDDGLQLPPVQDIGEFGDLGGGTTMMEHNDTPNSAPSPEGSPVGLSPVVPGAAAAPTGASSGSTDPLSSFMSQSPSVLSSWLDAFNQEFQDGRLNDEPPVLTPAAPAPSTLESRLSTLMQNFGNIPGGLFSTSSASNTPKRADSPPYGSSTARPAAASIAALVSELRSAETPQKDESSGQGTPVLDENSFLNKQGLSRQRLDAAPPISVNPHADVDLRQKPMKGDTDMRIPLNESHESKTAASTSGSDVPPSPVPVLVPPPLPPALQAYLEPIRTVTSSGPSATTPSSKVVPSPPAPSADYLIPVAENFDVTDMDLDDDSVDNDHGEAHHLPQKKSSNLITLVHSEESNGTPGQSTGPTEASQKDEEGSPPSVTVTTGANDPRRAREVVESSYSPPSKIETVQTRNTEPSSEADLTTSSDIWERREYYPSQQMSNGGSRMRGRGFYGYNDQRHRAPGGYQEDYGHRRGGFGHEWSPRQPRYQNYGGPPHHTRGPYYNPRY